MLLINSIVKRLHGLIQRMPLLGPLFQFSWDDHSRAFPKAVCLWLFSFLPIFFAAGMSKYSADQGDILPQFLRAIRVEFISQSQFVYAATLIPPLIFLIYDRYQEVDVRANEKIADRFQRGFRLIFKGYLIVFVSAIILLIFTAWTFAVKQTDPQQIGRMIAHEFIDRHSIYFYLLAVYFWYLALLDNFKSVGENFVDSARASEEDLVKRVAARFGGEELN